ncbi:hypothetical protein [Lactiplantibacillus paraxiangfangensis]|uniref:hypothetical protein n=1 Tax=Lactiplantibacillus paraxiangfangensis TaxID=3076224 RepID=UPI0030C74647
MKKVLVSSIVVAGLAVIGGGAYLWPKSDHVSSTQSAVSSSVVTSSKASSKAAAEKDSSKANDSSSTEKSKTSSGESTSSESKSTTTASSKSASTAATSSSQSGTTATSSTAGRNLTTTQVNNWAWAQVEKQYQGASVTKDDFLFQQYQRSGLVYVDVYENSSTEADHLAGRFRVNAQGSLEQQSLSNGSTWRVVATSPSN